MQCCGVNGPSDYGSAMDSSCCGQTKNSEKCTITDSYQDGCYSKLISYFKENNQLIIWTGIGFNTFTVRRNISSCEHSSL